MDLICHCAQSFVMASDFTPGAKFSCNSVQQSYTTSNRLRGKNRGGKVPYDATDLQPQF